MEQRTRVLWADHSRQCGEALRLAMLPQLGARCNFDGIERGALLSAMREVTGRGDTGRDKERSVSNRSGRVEVEIFARAAVLFVGEQMIEWTQDASACVKGVQERSRTPIDRVAYHCGHTRDGEAGISAGARVKAPLHRAVLQA